jgi:hypothetical protein
MIINEVFSGILAVNIAYLHGSVNAAYTLPPDDRKDIRTLGGVPPAA